MKNLTTFLPKNIVSHNNLKINSSSSSIFNNKYKSRNNDSIPQNFLTFKEIELVNSLSLDNLPNLPNIHKINRENIDKDIEIKKKRLGIKEEKKVLNIEDKEEFERAENINNKNKEFYKKYEMMRREKEMENEIVQIKKEYKNIKNLYIKKNNEINNLLNIINGFQIEIYAIHSQNKFMRQKNENFLKEINNNSKSENKKKQKQKMDNFMLKALQFKEESKLQKEIKNVELKIIKFTEELEKMKSELNEISINKKKIKKELDNKISELSNYYHKKLYEGLDIRQDGLIWIIKAIWNLDEKINTNYFPNFLDNDSIKYLFLIAHKSVEIQNIKNKIEIQKKKLNKYLKKENETINNENNINNYHYNIIKSNDNKKIKNINNKTINLSRNLSNFPNKITLKNLNNFYKTENLTNKIIHSEPMTNINKLNLQIKKIEDEILYLKNKELNRLFEHFCEDNYENKYNAIFETVVGALIGEKNRDSEIAKYKQKRIQIKDNMKNIQYYSITAKPQVLQLQRKENFYK